MKHHMLATSAALLLIAGPGWAAGSLLSAGPFFTRGNQIVDGAGNPQRLACVGWNGGNSFTPGLSGLDQVTYQATMSDMVRLGFNCTRVLTFARGVLNNTNGYLNTLDDVIDYAGAIGLRVIVDIHNDEGGHGPQDNWGTAPVNGLWYDKGGASDGTDGGGNIGTISDADFQQAWVNLATRWKDKPAILGYDLINEPHAGLTTWAGYDGAVGANTDIRAMYIRVGNSIHLIDPRPLIIAEGVQNYGARAYEGDLRGVTDWPVTLNIPDKVVYSPHIYPHEVSDVPADYGSTWIDRMNSLWAFIVKQDIAPVFVGECGDWLASADAQAWAAAFVSYVNGTAPGGPAFSLGQQGISWSWWNWGTSENGGAVPDFGVLTAWSGGSLKVQQASILNELFFSPSSNRQRPPRNRPPPRQPKAPPAWPHR
jgi:endoglucanase